MVTVDTHVHTCLSPCGELEMHPAAVAAAARDARLDGVVVCDHNAAGNVGAVARAGVERGVGVLSGLEITSAEEVHVQAILPDMGAALGLEARVREVLPGRNVPDAFGLQVLCDEHEEVLGYDEHLLAGATTWSLDEAIAAIHDASGLAVAAHADRETFGVIGQLGLVPERAGFDALEVSPHTSFARARATWSRGAPLLCGSDAHHPTHVGEGVTFLWAESPTFGELQLALADRGGRAVLGGGRPMEDLSLHLLDIAQNAVEAGASHVDIVVREDGDTLSVEVVDDGRGMSPEVAAKALDPFFTTRATRKVGLGLALLAEAARATGGDVELRSEEGRGTHVRATFGRDHVDRQPLGDLESTLMVLIAASPDVDVTFRHDARGRGWSLDSRRLADELGHPLSTPSGLAHLRAVIRAGETSVATLTHDAPSTRS